MEAFGGINSVTVALFRVSPFLEAALLLALNGATILLVYALTLPILDE